MSERDFKGVWIPKEIWLNKELTLLEKVIYTEIDSLDNEDNCIAGNEYFAEFCDCSTSKVTKAIKKLQDLEMIEIMSFDGRHRKIRVVKSTRQTSKKYEAESQKVRANNIDNNIVNNNTITINSNSTDFDFGTKKSQTKKSSLFDKCVSAIDDFTEDNILRELLIASLKLFLENSREAGTPFYTNTFKGKLNNLKRLSEDNYEQRKIVQQTLDNGWNGFYAIKDNRNKKEASTDIGYTSTRAKKGGKRSESKF